MLNAVSSLNGFEIQAKDGSLGTVSESSPPWDPTATISNEYERHLHNHYDWPGYGW